MATSNSRDLQALAETAAVTFLIAPAARNPAMYAPRKAMRAPVARGTHLAAYFLGVISAGRYREISKPAATWHMVGFFQLFFIALLL
jgi:hypothetical protein